MLKQLWCNALDFYQTHKQLLQYLCIVRCGAKYATYRQTSNISCTLVGNKIVDHLDVVGASPVGVAPTASSFTTVKRIGKRQLQDETRNL